MPINPVMPDNAPIEASEYGDGQLTPQEPQPETPPPPIQEPEPHAPPREEPEADPEPDERPDETTDTGKEQATRKQGLENRKQRIQEQINALVRERGEVTRETERGRAERAELQREIETLRAEKQRHEQPGQRPAPQETFDPRDPKPVEGHYDDYAQYTEAVARWGARQEFQAAERGRQQYQERASRQQWETQRQKSYSERYQAFAKANPSFEQEINRDDLLLTAPMVDVVKDSDVGPQILLHLSRNSDEVDRIAALHPVLAYGEMKKIEARLEGAHSGSPQQTAQHSKAPAPIKPVGNVASRRSDDSDIPGEDATDDEHFERMNKRDEMLRKRGINTRKGYGVRV